MSSGTGQSGPSSPAGWAERARQALRTVRDEVMGTSPPRPGGPEFPPAGGSWETGDGGARAAAAQQVRACAAAGMQALNRWYNSSTGQWNTAGWWNAANVLNTVVHYTDRTGDRTYADVVQTTFTAAQRSNPGFINSYYDDNGWWALAWLAAFDLTHDQRYLDAATAIFRQMTGGWDDVYRGGLWWTTAKPGKNAIPNELFLLLAARLHQRAGAAGGYLDWATREWEWFRASGLIGPAALVNDGLNAQGQNNNGTTWTYNQGVILGGLAALHEITGDGAHLEPAHQVAEATLRELTVPPPTASSGPGTPGPGILAEPCEQAGAGCNGDQAQFKGIFVRNLYVLHRRDPRPAYRDFILANARSIWDNDRNSRNQFGLHWAGPFDRADAIRQSSAQDALNAAVGLVQR